MINEEFLILTQKRGCVVSLRIRIKRLKQPSWLVWVDAPQLIHCFLGKNLDLMSWMSYLQRSHQNKTGLESLRPDALFIRWSYSQVASSVWLRSLFYDRVLGPLFIQISRSCDAKRKKCCEVLREKNLNFIYFFKVIIKWDKIYERSNFTIK